MTGDEGGERWGKTCSEGLRPDVTPAFTSCVMDGGDGTNSHVNNSGRLYDHRAGHGRVVKSNYTERQTLADARRPCLAAFHAPSILLTAKSELSQKSEFPSHDYNLDVGANSTLQDP